MIGIIAAMDAEIQEYEKKMDFVEKQKMIADCTLIYGKWKDKDVVLCKSGVGKSAAAMSCSILCMQEDVKVIINVGTAGGLKEDEQVLDIVISDKVCQADFDTSPLDGPEGIGLVYNSDDSLRKLFVDASIQSGVRYHVGMVASQDLFMSRKEDYDKLLSRFPESICSEMEAGAVAQVATSFKIPFVVVRSLSDVVSQEGNQMEFSTYVSKASAQSAALIDYLLQNI